MWTHCQMRCGFLCSPFSKNQRWSISQKSAPDGTDLHMTKGNTHHKPSSLSWALLSLSNMNSQQLNPSPIPNTRNLVFFSIWRYGCFSESDVACWLFSAHLNSITPFLKVCVVNLIWSSINNRILCDKKFRGKVTKATLQESGSYKALYYRKSLIENKGWTRKSSKVKKKPILVLQNNKLNHSCLKFNGNNQQPTTNGLLLQSLTVLYYHQQTSFLWQEAVCLVKGWKAYRT